MASSYAEVGIPVQEEITVNECGETFKDEKMDQGFICAELNSSHCEGRVATSTAMGGIICLNEEYSEKFHDDWELDI